MAILLLLTLFRRHFRDARPYLYIKPPPEPFRRNDLILHERFITTRRDGTEIKASSSQKRSSRKATGKQRVMLLAAPLGQCGPDIYIPIMARFGSEFIYVTWDYRGTPV